jgi:predicted protein tyrosine phosphatase
MIDSKTMGKAQSKIRTIVCGLDQLDRYSSTGVTHVLSILDPEYPDPNIFRTYRPRCRISLHFHDEINSGPNIVLPKITHIESILSLARSVAEDHAKGGNPHVLVHCHMGISRSTAAMAILLSQIRQKEYETAVFAELLRLQPDAWPNCLMIELADKLLGRQGQLTAALGSLYGLQLAKRPEMGNDLRKDGRGREVDLGIHHGSLKS